MMHPGKNPRASQAGNIMIVISLGIFGIAALTVSAYMISATGRRDARQRSTYSRLDTTATATNDALFQSLWDHFHENTTAQCLADLRAYLNDSSNLLGTALPDGGEVRHLAGDPILSSWLQSATQKFAGTHVKDLSVRRTDSTGGTMLEFTATVAAGTLERSETRSVTQSFHVGEAAYEGLDYALLAVDNQCTICHLTVDNVARVHNVSEDLTDSFKPTKIGNLGHLEIDDWGNVFLAADLYVGGTILNPYGDQVPALLSALDGAQRTSAGRLDEGAEGELTWTSLNGLEHQFLEYPLGPSGASSVTLPAEFPAPIPDLDGDRMVDAAEVLAVIGNVKGTLAGGIRYEVASGSYIGGSLPATSNIGTITGSHSANLFLIGSQANPLLLDGDVFIDGDLVISGYTKGQGAIYTSGNIYILGSLEYLDGTFPGSGAQRNFGVAADGTINATALVSGGAIIMGQPSTPNETRPTEEPFAQQIMSMTNRDEFTKASSTLPNATGIWLANPNYDASYVPKYLGMKAGDPLWVWVGSESYYDFTLERWLDNWTPHVSSVCQAINSGDPFYDRAHFLMPDWFSEATFDALHAEAVALWPVGDPLRIDGLMYSNIAILCFARSDRGGKILVQGSLIAPTVAVLSMFDTKLYFDERVQRLVHLPRSQPLEVERRLWRARSR